MHDIFLAGPAPPYLSALWDATLLVTHQCAVERRDVCQLTCHEDCDPLGPTRAARSSRSARYSLTLSTSRALKPLTVLLGVSLPTPACDISFHTSPSDVLSSLSLTRDGSVDRIHTDNTKGHQKEPSRVIHSSATNISHNLHRQVRSCALGHHSLVGQAGHAA